MRRRSAIERSERPLESSLGIVQRENASLSTEHAATSMPCSGKDALVKLAWRARRGPRIGRASVDEQIALEHRLHRRLVEWQAHLDRHTERRQNRRVDIHEAFDHSIDIRAA